MSSFLRAIEALNSSGVGYVIVGGFAAVMHGSHRATRDLDVVVDLEPAEAMKAIEALISIGLKSRAPVDPREFADPSKRRKWREQKGALVFTMIDPVDPVFAVDLFIEAPVEWNALLDRSVELKSGGQTFRVCGIADLIDMKNRAGRPQDLVDIAELRRILGEGG